MPHSFAHLPHPRSRFSLCAATTLSILLALACSWALVALGSSPALADDAVAVHGGSEGTPEADTLSATPASTAKSALTSVTVTPPSVTYDNPKTRAVFTAVPNAEAAGETLTYQWQYLSEPGPGYDQTWEDQDGPEAKRATFTAPQIDQYDTSYYRCRVRPANSTDDQAWVASDRVSITLIPVAPKELKTTSIATNSAQVEWTMEARLHMDTSPLEYEVAWRVRGTEAWSTATTGDTTFSLSNLLASTVYEWRARALPKNKPEDLPSVWSDVATFATYSNGGLTQATISPTSLRYDATAGGNAMFTVYADAPNNGLTFIWQWRPSNDADWTDVSGNANFSANAETLTVNESFAETDAAHGSSTRCIVSDATGAKHETPAAQLLHLDAEPVNLAARDASASSATLSWTDANENAGTYTLQYRKTATSASANAIEDAAREAATLANEEGWTSVEGIQRDPSGTTIYTLDALDPSVAYEWRVAFVSITGGAGTWAFGGRFQTLPGPALNIATLKPETSIVDAGKTVNLVVSTNVDSDPDETLAYRWETALRGSDTWSEVAGATAASLSVKAGDADRGVRYRCVVTGTKNGLSVDLTTNEADVWTRFDVATPGNLAASNVTSNSAVLSWTCDAQAGDTFKVEYRAKGASTWTVVEGLTQPKLTLSALSPTTEYEWRATHIVIEGLTSETVAGPGFTTKETPGKEPDKTPDKTPDGTPDKTPDKSPDGTPDNTPDKGPDATVDGTPDPNEDGAAKATPLKRSTLASTGDPVPAAAFATCALFAFAVAAAALLRRRKA